MEYSVILLYLGCHLIWLVGWLVLFNVPSTTRSFIARIFFTSWGTYKFIMHT